MGIAEKLVQRVPETGARPGKDAGEVAETGDATLCRRGVAHVQDHAGGDRGGGVLPITLLGRVLARAHDHIRHVLGVGDVARRSEPNFGQRD